MQKKSCNDSVHGTAVNQLKSNTNFRRCLVPGVLAKAEEEADRLLPHFKVLNAGKGSQSTGEERAESFGSVKRRRVDAPTEARPDLNAVKASAKMVYDWVKLGERSNYRMLLNFLSAGGVFYAFQAADKTTRAWVETKDVKADQFENIASARHQEAAPATASATKREAAAGDLFA